MKQGTKPRQALPGIIESLGGGRPKRYLEKISRAYLKKKRILSIGILIPDWAELGDDKGKKESGNGREDQGAWKGA